MISKDLLNLLNEQINTEMWSAYLYLAMSMDAESKGLKGVANWFYVQYREELDHARVFMNYINARNERVELKAIEAVPTHWNTLKEMFNDTYKHEQEITKRIHKLASQAKADNDFATFNRLTWFIDEQIEEEESVRDMITAVEAVEDNKYGLYMLDKELAARNYKTLSILNEEF